MLPKIQHYVPQFILANFCVNNGSQIYVFDKKQGTVFRTHIKNIAAEKGFYNFEEGEASVSIEPNLSQLESVAANLIKKIIEEESLASVIDEEKLLLSIFIAAQFARVKQTRITIKQLNDDLTDKIRAMGFDPNNVDGFTPQDETEVKKSTVSGLRRSIAAYTPYIYDKAWLLFKAPKSTPHYISDNPITLQNMNDYSPRGNLGLAVKGIEIYFPISGRLSLGIFCRSYEEMIRTGYQKYVAIKRAGLLKKVGGETEGTASVKRLKHGLETGDAVRSKKENVINRNSLQVIYSTRFVYSGSDEFDLVREMLEAHPELKEAPRMISS